MRKRIFDLVGESFANADRSSRQEALSQCYPGDTIILVREPQNPHDNNAILVTTCDGAGLGHIGRDDAESLAPIVDSGRPYQARIHELRGGLKGYETLGCRISIAFDNEKFRPHILLKAEQIEHRKKRPASSTGCLALVPLIISIPIVAYWFI